MNVNIRDRIVEFTRIKASELTPHPQNWREHPKAQQAAMSGILKEVGYVDAIMVREHEGGYQIIDGHLRAETTPDATVPVLVVDLDDAETALVLATFDPIGAMATTDQATLNKLLLECNVENSDLLSIHDEDDSELITLKIQEPPKMTWVLVGIPTVRFGEISDTVEALALLDESIVEVCANNG